MFVCYGLNNKRCVYSSGLWNANGLDSRAEHTGCEKHLLFTLRLLTRCSGSWLMQCVITPILMGTCLMSLHKPLISSQGRHLLRTRKARIYISDIFLAKPLIYFCFPLCWISKQGFAHLFLPYKYMFPWKNCTHLKYEIGLRNISFQHQHCNVSMCNSLISGQAMSSKTN